MGKNQKSKRARNGMKARHREGRQGAILNDPAFLYRWVEEPSADLINRATRGVHGARTARITDNFTLALLYPRKLRELAEKAPNPHQLSAAEIARSLGSLPLASLAAPVTARVKDIRQIQRAFGITVEYPEYIEEELAMRRAAKEMLELPSQYVPDIGPEGDGPHLNIIVGELTPAQINHIKSRLPDQIHLSPLNSMQPPADY